MCHAREHEGCIMHLQRGNCQGMSMCNRLMRRAARRREKVLREVMRTACLGLSATPQDMQPESPQPPAYLHPRLHTATFWTALYDSTNMGAVWSVLRMYNFIDSAATWHVMAMHAPGIAWSRFLTLCTACPRQCAEVATSKILQS